MSAQSVAATFGLIALVAGVLLVNVISTPFSAQIGTIVAGIGVILLVACAIGRLFF